MISRKRIFVLLFSMAFFVMRADLLIACPQPCNCSALFAAYESACAAVNAAKEAQRRAYRELEYARWSALGAIAGAGAASAGVVNGLRTGNYIVVTAGAAATFFTGVSFGMALMKYGDAQRACAAANLALKEAERAKASAWAAYDECTKAEC